MIIKQTDGENQPLSADFIDLSISVIEDSAEILDYKQYKFHFTVHLKRATLENYFVKNTAQREQIYGADRIICEVYNALQHCYRGERIFFFISAQRSATVTKLILLSKNTIQ